MPSSQSDDEPHAEPLAIKKETVYHENEVAYISDKIGVHHVANPDPDNVAVSMHCEYPSDFAEHCHSIVADRS